MLEINDNLKILKDDHQAVIHDIKASHSTEVKEIKASKDEVIEQLRAAHQEEMTAARNQSELKIAQLMEQI